MLKFSIIINNYNYAPFLHDAIESALSQSYPNLEIILVDDGSTDNSRAIIEKYRIHDRIQIILKENGGQASAFNAGFASSTGDLVLFLDSDDRLLPNACERAAAAWIPGSSRLSFDLNVINTKGESLEETYSQMFFEGTMDTGDLRSRVAAYEMRCIPTSGNVFSSKVLSRIFPLNEGEWRICADTPIFALSVFFGPALSIPFALGEYRLHDNNGWFQIGQISPKVYLKQMELRKKTEDCLRNYEDIIGRRIYFPKGDIPYWQAKLAFSILDERRKGLFSIVKNGVSSAWSSKEGLFERCVMCLWFPWVAFMPRWLASKVLQVELPINIPQVNRQKVREAKLAFTDQNQVVSPD